MAAKAKEDLANEQARVLALEQTIKTFKEEADQTQVSKDSELQAENELLKYKLMVSEL